MNILEGWLKLDKRRKRESQGMAVPCLEVLY